jgi:hypothetical protein
MKLKEIFDQLTYGELSQLSIGGGDLGAIQAKDYDRILAHINLGMTALHKRFNLKESNVLLELQSGRTLYPIKTAFAVTGKSKEPIRFLKDSLEVPFKDNVHKIERVYTDKGVELSINDQEDQYSLSTPQVTMLRVPASIVNNPVDFPENLMTKTLDIYYRANSLPIVTDDGDLEPESVEVDLPYAYLEPLLLFIAARMHAPLGTGQLEGFGASNYYARYEAACQDLENFDLDVDQVSQPDRLHNKGFV